MTGSERPSPDQLLKKEASPAVLRGGENSGNALEPSNALNCRARGISAILSRGIPGKALRAFPGFFRKFSLISSVTYKDYITEIVLELFFGAVMLTGDVKDFRTAIPDNLGPLSLALRKLISGAVTYFYIKIQLPSDTKLLLTKNYFEIIIFEKLRISYVIPWKSPSFRRFRGCKTPQELRKIILRELFS